MMKRFLSVPSDWLVLPCLLVLALGLTACSDEGDSVVPDTPDVPEDVDPASPAPDSSALVQPLGAIADAAYEINAPEGYRVDHVYTTTKDDEGTWVSICAGPNGTLFAAAQGDRNLGRGVYHIVPPALDDPNGEATVTRVPVAIGGAQGLCYAFDSLYVMETGTGIQRLTDTDGDGTLDSKEQLVAVRGGGEHGTHAIVLSPDGTQLYFCGGNMTPMPEYDASLVPVLWDEDQVLPREPDARGHASRVMAPGGWIASMNPDGSDVTIVCNGFRNQYDFDFMPNGELFAYDADMEWDLGMPWYRPTRINHVTSGAEFGWRNGSGKWPTYFEDSLPAAIEIGPGSPVGVTFGTGSNFPTRYQSALFALDWTYGTIYAIHLEADGATYTGELEPFLTGKPLPLTDAAIADDGAMYFTTGGRGMDSSLYRVTYVGDASTAAPEPQPLTELAQLRRQLEELHAPEAAKAENLPFIWENLDHEDRFVRFAARVALEHASTELFLEPALSEEDPMKRTAAGMALARQRHPDAMDVLLGVELDKDNPTLCAAWERAVGIVFARSEGAPSDEVRTAVLGKIAALELAPTDNVNVLTEAVRLRVYLNDPTVIPFALDLMAAMNSPTPPWIPLAAQNDRYGSAIRNLADNPPPSAQFGIAFMLRNMTDGWDIGSRQTYFGWLNLAARGAGGNSYQGYVQRVREQAIATLTDAERTALGDLLNPPAQDLPPIVQPQGPGRPWNIPRAVATIQRVPLNNQNFAQGQGLFQGVTCSQCHRVNDLGGQTGPDLTSLSANFSVEDLMRAIIEPSADVSDQYQQSVVTKADGSQVIGRIIVADDQVVTVKTDPIADTTVDIPRAQVESIEVIATSLMPANLLNSMSAQELRDLTAYLMAGGDPTNEMFAQPEAETVE